MGSLAETSMIFVGLGEDVEIALIDYQAFFLRGNILPFTRGARVQSRWGLKRLVCCTF